jgi:CBS domain-containing protein
MSHLVFSLPEGATVPQAAALMAYEGVHRAPVVSVDDRVVGIVSSLDVLKWLGRHYGFVVPDRTG